MNELSKAVILDEDKILLKLYRHFLENKGYNVFTTDNPYKLLLYGREIKPEAVFMDINLSRRNNWELLKKINHENWMKHTPVIIMSPTHQHIEKNITQIANIIDKDAAIEKIIELLETYCRGGQNHDIFILADYTPELEKELAIIKKWQQSFFIAHDLKGFRKYLSKNKPRKIAVKYSSERFEMIKNELPQENIYRIDSISQIKI
ncbi:MAG: response regulator [Alphaproteobacteria bacterium]|nr:response regulator [Alphaproteobacteria bacterium]MBQ7285307.1 response regulator [Alphaproteobacteria bacterium]